MWYVYSKQLKWALTSFKGISRQGSGTSTPPQQCRVKNIKGIPPSSHRFTTYTYDGFQYTSIELIRTLPSQFFSEELLTKDSRTLPKSNNPPPCTPACVPRGHYRKVIKVNQCKVYWAWTGVRFHLLFSMHANAWREGGGFVLRLYGLNLISG